MLRYYPAVIHKAPDSDYGVSFPDFPGCVTAGRTHSEALILAKEAISFHIEGMLEDGERLPEPTPWEKLPKEKFTDDGGNLVTLVEAAVPGPSRRANITIEESLLDEIDSAAAALGTNRSAFLCEAARWKLDQMFERRLDAAMGGDARMVDVLRRLAAEDEKVSSRKRNPRT